MAFLDADALERGDATRDQRAADAAAPVVGAYREVLQVAPTTVVAGKDAADDGICVATDEAQAGVAFEVARGGRVRSAARSTTPSVTRSRSVTAS